MRTPGRVRLRIRSNFRTSAPQKIDAPQEVLDLIEKRKDAKKAKDFALADKIRSEIAALGYEIKDTREGVTVTKIQ